MDSQFQEYFQAGYNKAYSEEPPYKSSPASMAFYCGVWCRDHNIDAMEIKESRGYKWIVNRHYVLNFKDNDTIPTVTTIK